jgi:ATP-binding cassette, subfamily B, bacterial
MLHRLVAPTTALQNIGVQVSRSMAMPAESPRSPGDFVGRLDAVRGEVRMTGVSFRYDGDRIDGDWTLPDIDLLVSAGTTTAIVGETGAGKTTLAYHVARHYDVDRGAVFLDGHDVRELTLDSVSDAVGLVAQDTYLFHDTLGANLRFAAPDATDAELDAAVRAARIDRVVASLPQGYDTVVGARGYRFSGGERQRLAIARMLLRNPGVLILDEATSALDTETERAVQAALDELARGRTTIAIAHRLSTVRQADQILVLDRGRIVERGTHPDLLARGGRYARLAGALTG